MVVPDLLYNIQCIIQLNVAASQKYSEELIGSQGVLNSFLDTSKCGLPITQNQLHLCLSVLKCMCSITSVPDENKASEQPNLSSELKEQVSQLVVNFLMRITKGQDEYQYCKVVVTALRVLSQIYFNDQTICIPLPELMGISRYFLVYGLVVQGLKPEKIMPAQQTIATVPNTINRDTKGGKKQKLRKQRNNAIESLKKEIPVSEKSLMREVENFENISTYRPASQNYLEPQKARNYWVLTSDSDASDVESSREAKLVALRSRVRQSAANLLLVLTRVSEKRDIFGYWWALLPDSPEVDNWTATDAAKKTLAYCAVTDPTSNNRASVLSVILALLSGPRMYLSQAEVSKKDNASFIPFSVSLGYMIDCLHKVLTTILDSERSHAVVLVALKCCAALVQATPYYKMKAGLVSELVRASRKFLVHKSKRFKKRIQS
ncbi:HEAT repeat-containing protein 6-like isoform X2 [Leguminivora glycinivorella]|uniref:HEAT repeat-containing protein 6-like isoform X2 n=1 Tax=Leguminivora glycinivorella TaxID=1035111 RepID=UPI00200E7CA2|nr:HEAT repeat-containing protein 6-like isoform X2 [Leguminivora glycinivorella]